MATKTKGSLQILAQQQLTTNLGVPKLDFLTKLTAREMELLVFHATNALKAQRIFGIKVGFTIAKSQAEKKGMELSLPAPKSIKIKPSKREGK